MARAIPLADSGSQVRPRLCLNTSDSSPGKWGNDHGQAHAEIFREASGCLIKISDAIIRIEKNADVAAGAITEQFREREKTKEEDAVLDSKFLQLDEI